MGRREHCLSEILMLDQNQLSELVILITTEAEKSKADKLSELVLERRLAACINFRQISSIYWWEEKLERDEEVQLIIKTTVSKIDELQDLILKNHSYETPELIQIPIKASEDYMLWVNKVTLSSR